MDAMTLIIVLALVTLASGLAFAGWQRMAAARAQREDRTSSLARSRDRGQSSD